MTAITSALFLAMFLLVSHLQGALHGYLDPGTGSIAVQLVIGGLVAALATAKLYWQRLRAFLRRTPVEHDATTESH
jgi:membrane associated rhomboid family serine protease